MLPSVYYVTDTYVDIDGTVLGSGVDAITSTLDDLIESLTKGDIKSETLKFLFKTNAVGNIIGTAVEVAIDLSVGDGTVSFGETALEASGQAVLAYAAVTIAASAGITAVAPVLAITAGTTAVASIVYDIFLEDVVEDFFDERDGDPTVELELFDVSGLLLDDLLGGAVYPEGLQSLTHADAIRAMALQMGKDGFPTFKSDLKIRVRDGENSETYELHPDSFLTELAFATGVSVNDILLAGNNIDSEAVVNGNQSIFFFPEGKAALTIPYLMGGQLQEVVVNSIYRSSISDIEGFDADGELLFGDGSGKRLIFTEAGKRLIFTEAGKLAGIEQLGSEGGVFVGAEKNDQILGYIGDDILLGSAGNDTILSSGGKDTIVGGTGQDTLDYSLVDTEMVIDLEEGFSILPNGIKDVIDGVEAVIGTAFSDRFYGDNKSNVFEPGGGNDLISAGNPISGSDFDIIKFAGSFGTNRVSQGEQIIIDGVIATGQEAGLDFELEQNSGGDIVGLRISKGANSVLLEDWRKDGDYGIALPTTAGENRFSFEIDLDFSDQFSGGKLTQLSVSGIIPDVSVPTFGNFSIVAIDEFSASLGGATAGNNTTTSVELLNNIGSVRQDVVSIVLDMPPFETYFSSSFQPSGHNYSWGITYIRLFLNDSVLGDTGDWPAEITEQDLIRMEILINNGDDENPGLVRAWGFNSREDGTNGDSNTFLLEDVELSIGDGVSTAPVAVNDGTLIEFETSVLIDVLSNDSDAIGVINAETLRIIDGADSGSATVTAGVIRYTPNAGFSGLDSFTYTVEDDSGAQSNVATVYVFVEPDQTSNEVTVRTQTLDDGRIVETTFVDGEPSSKRLEDAGDAFPWLVQDITFDDEGNRETVLTVHDNGKEVETTFEGGIRALTEGEDLGDAHRWSSFIKSYRPDGSVDFSSRLLDDGREIETTFVDGVRSRTVISDVADDFVWTSKVRRFDEDGVIDELIVTFDDGRVRTINYEDGIQTQSIMVDEADIYSWTSQTVTFDNDGKRESRSTLFDDGREVVVEFDDNLPIA